MLNEIKDALRRIERTQQAHTYLLAQILNLENTTMAKIDDVAAAVEAETSVDQSAITLLNQLTQMIKDAGTDPAKLDAVIASINANKQALADAVAANTPAA